MYNYLKLIGLVVITGIGASNHGCKSNAGGINEGPAPTIIPTFATVPAGNGEVTVGPGTSTTPVPVPSGVSGTLDYSVVLAEEAKTKCTGESKMVDRAKRDCISGTTLEAVCTTDSVKLAFGGSGDAAVQTITGLQGQGFTLDQCGKLNGKAYASLYRTLGKDGLPAIEIKFIAPQ